MPSFTVLCLKPACACDDILPTTSVVWLGVYDHRRSSGGSYERGSSAIPREDYFYPLASCMIPKSIMRSGSRADDLMHNLIKWTNTKRKQKAQGKRNYPSGWYLRFRHTSEANNQTSRWKYIICIRRYDRSQWDWVDRIAQPKGQAEYIFILI